MRGAQMEARRQVESVVNQMAREGSADAATSETGRDIEMANAPVRRRGVVFILCLRANRLDRMGRHHRPERRLTIFAVGVAAPAFDEPIKKSIPLTLRFFTEGVKPGGEFDQALKVHREVLQPIE